MHERLPFYVFQAGIKSLMSKSSHLIYRWIQFELDFIPMKHAEKSKNVKTPAWIDLLALGDGFFYKEAPQEINPHSSTAVILKNV